MQILEPTSNSSTYIGSLINGMLSNIYNLFLYTSLLPTNPFAVLNMEGMW